MPIGPSTTFTRRELAERNLRAGRRGHHDVLAQRPQVGTEIAVVTQVDRVALQAFDGRGQRHAAERDGQNILHVADGQAVARDGVAINFKFDEAPAHHAFGERARGAGNLADDSLDLGADAFERGEIRPGDLDADGRLDAGGKHVNARANGHGPRVVQAGNLHGVIHRIGQFVRRAFAMGDDFAVVILDVHGGPFRLRLEADGRFDHVHRRGIGGGLGAAGLAENFCNFGK